MSTSRSHPIGVLGRWLARRARRRQLSDRVEITEALRRYATGIDRRDFELVRSAYHPGAFDDHGAWTGTCEELIDYPHGTRSSRALTNSAGTAPSEHGLPQRRASTRS